MKKESCIWNLFLPATTFGLISVSCVCTTFVGTWAKAQQVPADKCDQRLDWQDRRRPDSGTLCSHTIREEATHEEGRSLYL